jgi:hypothetical protein
MPDWFNLENWLDSLSGKGFYRFAGNIWNDIITLATGTMLKNPTKGVYSDTWGDVTSVYTTLNVLAGVLVTLFFLYGFCRESTDLHAEMSFDRTIKLFIRLIIVVNVVTFGFRWIPDFIKWGTQLTGAVLGVKKFGFYFDGAEIYDQIADAGGGGIVTFLTSFIFFAYTCICAFMVVIPVIKRVLRIYMITPFCGLALSTLAAGGQLSQIGYSYIRSFFGYILEALLIAMAIVLSTTFINTIVIKSDNAIMILVEYCLKMGAITSAVKGAEAMMQKAFNL